MLITNAVYGIIHNEAVKTYERLLQHSEIYLEELLLQMKYNDAKRVYEQLIKIAEKYFPNHPSFYYLLASLCELPEN